MKQASIIVGLLLIITACQTKVSAPRTLTEDNVKDSYYTLKEALKNRILVKELSLKEVGDLDSIHLFPNLENLYIRNYSKEGQVLRLPERLFSLKKLYQVDVSGCVVTLPSKIPTSSQLTLLSCWLADTAKVLTSLENCSSLKQLHIIYKGKKTFPLRLGYLSHLNYMELTIKGLTELPEGIEKLSKLRYLTIYSESEQGLQLPPSFAQLKELKVLDLPLMKQLPENFQELQAVENLSIGLEKSSMKEVLTEIAELPQLTTLKIRGIEGKEFYCPVVFDRLEELDVSYQYLTDFSCSMKNLKRLKLSANRFKQLPLSITQHKKLEYLDLSYSFQLKTLPVELTQLKQLRELELEGTTIGNLEEINFRKMPQLRRINLQDTKVSSKTKDNIQKQTPKECSFDGFIFICF